MGRGSSSGGGIQSVSSVRTQSGDIADLTGTPLRYGRNDSAVSGAVRQAVEAQERRRQSAKTEYYLATDANGNPIGGEIKGSKGSVRIPRSIADTAEITTHNHPRGAREEGCIGGTFSIDDIWAFTSKVNQKTSRASAAEGTYSITKGKDFNAQGFMSYFSRVKDARDREYRAKLAETDKKYRNGGFASFADYTKAYHQAFNIKMVNVHNDLISGQKQYGYSYTLERPR